MDISAVCLCCASCVCRCNIWNDRKHGRIQLQTRCMVRLQRRTKNLHLRSQTILTRTTSESLLHNRSAVSEPIPSRQLLSSSWKSSWRIWKHTSGKGLKLNERDEKVRTRGWYRRRKENLQSEPEKGKKHPEREQKGGGKGMLTDKRSGVFIALLWNLRLVLRRSSLQKYYHRLGHQSIVDEWNSPFFLAHAKYLTWHQPVVDPTHCRHWV